MNNSTQAYAMINDAIHGVMSFPEKHKNLFKALIDSETFQRLRHIKQLGMTDLIFPTAVHNRFSHCLGAAYVACMMSDKLRLKPDEKKYAIIGALLHDIGHGPFSHAFEELLQNPKSEKIKHEEWTELFLKEFEIVLNENGIDYKVLSQVIRKKYDMSGKYNISNDIVTSQLDADRLDYLLRDSHFCGVPYGNPDIRWIINHCTIIEETTKPPRLGFLRKGWPAIEHFLLCRRIMTQNVYHHHKKNVLERLLVEFLKAVSEAVSENDAVKKLITNTNLKKFLVNSICYREGKIEKKDFIEQNFDNYKTLTDDDIWMLIRDFSMNLDSKIMNLDSNIECARQIAERIYQRNIHHSFGFKESSLGAVRCIIEKIKKQYPSIKDWQLFITTPKIVAYEKEESPILILDEEGKVQSIHSYSTLLNIIGDQQEKEGYLAVDLEVWEDKEKQRHLKKKMKGYITFREAKKSSRKTKKTS